MAVQKGLNIEDLNLKHTVLIDTLHDWRSLHAKATKYLKGSLVLRDKYPEEMAGEVRDNTDVEVLHPPVTVAMVRDDERGSGRAPLRQLDSTLLKPCIPQAIFKY